MKIKIIVFSALIVFCADVFSQIGGNSTYSILNLPVSARISALGGDVIAVQDNDLTLIYNNPSLLNDKMDNHFAINVTDYFSDINFGSVTYARTYKDYGNFAANLQFVGYGKLDRADQYGTIQGEFNASDYLLNLTWSKSLTERVMFGANTKFIYSAYDNYTSFGMAADLGLTYSTEDDMFTSSLVVRNAGSQIKPFVEGNYEPLPFDVQLGFAKRLKHAPFRFSCVFHNLTKYDLTYNNPLDPKVTIDPISGEEIKANKLEEHADKLMRHVTIAAEFIPIKNFYMQFAYNYKRRQELKINTRTHLVGMSFGVGLKIKKIRINYGRAMYHLAGSPNYLTISTNLSEFYKKKS